MKKKKHKHNKWQKQFIEDHGIELYRKMLWAFPHLKDIPKTWKYIPKLAEIIARNAPFKCTMEDIYEGWTDDYEGGSNDET